MVSYCLLLPVPGFLSLTTKPPPGDFRLSGGWKEELPFQAVGLSEWSDGSLFHIKARPLLT